MLKLENVTARYGRTQALFGIDLQVERGETVALVGTNGAGKTTTLRAILGLVDGEGAVRVDGKRIDGRPTHRRVREHRIAAVHEGRGLLTSLTVAENLLVGTSRSDRDRLPEVLELFPVLRGRLDQRVSLLSGGQQQMVALGRAILRDPAYLLLDEPALGLAPVVIDEIYGTIARLCASGMGVVLVEQSVTRASDVADRLCLVRLGRVETTIGTDDRAGVQRLVAEAFDIHQPTEEGTL